MASTNASSIKGLSLDYWKYWVGQFVSNIGNSFTYFGLPLLIFVLTGSALDFGIGAAISMLPNLLFGLVAGALIDRTNRRMILILSNLLQGIVILTIPLFNILHILTIGWIYAVMFLMTVGSVFFNAAQFSAIPAIVSEDALEEANARIQTSISITTIAGPVLAGLLISIIPVTSLFLFDAMSFGAAVISLMTIKKSFHLEGVSSEKLDFSVILKDIREGLSYVWKHQLLRALFLLLMLSNFFLITPQMQILFFAEDTLHLSSGQIGVLFASEGIGILIMTFLVKQISARFSFRTLILGAHVAEGALLIVMAAWHLFWIALFLWAVVNALVVLVNINITSLEQRIVPNVLLGRINSVDIVLSWCIMPLGMLTGGAAISATNRIDWVYGVCGLSLLVIGLAFFLTRFGQSDVPAQSETPESTKIENSDEAVPL